MNGSPKHVSCTSTVDNIGNVIKMRTTQARKKVETVFFFPDILQK